MSARSCSGALASSGSQASSRSAGNRLPLRPLAGLSQARTPPCEGCDARRRRTGGPIGHELRDVADSYYKFPNKASRLGWLVLRQCDCPGQGFGAGGSRSRPDQPVRAHDAGTVARHRLLLRQQRGRDRRRRPIERGGNHDGGNHRGVLARMVTAARAAHAELQHEVGDRRPMATTNKSLAQISKTGAGIRATKGTSA